MLLDQWIQQRHFKVVYVAGTCKGWNRVLDALELESEALCEPPYVDRKE